MCPPLVLLLITIIQATLALSRPSKTWKVLEAVVKNGLYERNLTIKRGPKILCDIPPVFSPHNATCDDNVSSVFLHSSNFLNLITEATNKTYFLEYDGKSSKLNDSESFASQEEACNYVYRMGNLTDPSRRKAEDSTDSDEDLLLLKILLPIILIAIIIIIAVIAVFRWNKRRHQRGENSPIPGDQNHNPEHPEHQPLNSQNTPPISNTQNGTHMTHGNGVLSGQYIRMVSMDSSRPPTSNAIC